MATLLGFISSNMCGPKKLALKVRHGAREGRTVGCKILRLIIYIEYRVGGDNAPLNLIHLATTCATAVGCSEVGGGYEYGTFWEWVGLCDSLCGLTK